MEVNIKKSKLIELRFAKFALTITVILLATFQFGGFASADTLIQPPGGGGAGTATAGTATAGTANNCPQSSDNDALSSCCQPGNTTNGCINDTQSDTAASCNDNSGSISQCNLIAKYVNPAIDIFSALFGLVAVISIITGGISFATSEGDPQKVAKAKSRIVNTIIAIIAYLFLFSFLQFLVPGGLFNR